jgi:plasmid maintenance system killer protein
METPLAAALKSRTTATISHDGDEPLAQHGVVFRQFVRSQHSIRTNDQWRLCFRWKGEDVHEVEIVDYY